MRVRVRVRVRVGVAVGVRVGVGVRIRVRVIRGSNAAAGAPTDLLLTYYTYCGRRLPTDLVTTLTTDLLH